MIRVGCCGFPGKKEEYYGRFDVVEIETSFYNLPNPGTAVRWSSEAPEGFAYVLKAWQTITHPADSPTYRRTRLEIPESKKGSYGFFRPTGEVQEAWERTREIADLLNARMILFQCPPSFEETPENVLNVRMFFERIGKVKFALLWEPRGGWTGDTVRGLCKDLGLVHCVDPFKEEQAHGEFSYYRLHGRGGYGYRFTDGDLEELAMIGKEKKDSWVMFNNISMLEDASRFKFLVAEK
jgi:uncharacterized protein YecE (DUF72 family)